MARLLQQAFHQTRVSKKCKCSLPDIHEKIISPSAPMSYCVKNSRPFDVATMQRAPLAGVGISYSAIITPFSIHSTDLVSEIFSEPKIAVGADRDAARRGIRCRNGELGDRAVARDAAERVGAGFDEPDAAIGMKRHRARLAVGRGMGNSVTAPSSVMRRDAAACRLRLNQSAPSRTTMESGRLPGVMPAPNSTDAAVGRDARDAIDLAFGKPDIAVRPERDAVGRGFRRRQRELGDRRRRR